MKNKFALTAGLILLSGLGLAFAGTPKKAAAIPAEVKDAKTADVKAEDPKTREFKDILFKLVRQDEYLDEAIDTLDSSNGRMSAHDISAMGLSLKLIAGNLDKVAALNKGEFASVQPGSPNAKYIATIFSYSSKVSRKSAQVGKIVAGLASSNRKAAMRDAVSSKKGSKKAKGKKLDQMLAEQQALKQLAADAKTLGTASRGVAATSKWLYISSK
jgi:hypothetical protein